MFFVYQKALMFDTNISNQFFDYKDNFVNSQHENANSKGDSFKHSFVIFETH